MATGGITRSCSVSSRELLINEDEYGEVTGDKDGHYGTYGIIVLVDDGKCMQYLKLPSLSQKIIPKSTQMYTLYTNLSLYIIFTMIYYIRQE